MVVTPMLRKWRRWTEFGLRLAAIFSLRLRTSDFRLMKRLLVSLLAGTLAAPLLVAQRIHPRPGEGRQPELKPPTIREYKPRSQLVAPQHPVPRAKFPAIDIHSHQPTPISPAEYDRVMMGMEANNLQILVNLSGASGDRLRQGIDALRASKARDSARRRPGSSNRTSRPARSV